MKKLTNSEMQVMELLWDCNVPLTTSEMVDYCKDRIWKASYIHIIVKSLLDKEMIQIAGFKKTVKNYARTFEASMSKEDWLIMQVKGEQKDNPRVLLMLLKSLLEEEEDIEYLDELAERVRQYKCNLPK